jgi:hypothetical protein
MINVSMAEGKCSQFLGAQSQLFQVMGYHLFALAGIEDGTALIGFDPKSHSMFSPQSRAPLHSVVNNANYLFHDLAFPSTLISNPAPACR